MALQETYNCTDNFAEAKRFNGKLWTFPNPGTAHSAGTGFIVHREGVPSDLRKEDFTHKVLIPGRLDTLSWKWGEETFLVANLYAPNSEQVAIPFFKQVISLLRRETVDVILGDWNHVEKAIDRIPQRAPSTAMRDVLSDLRTGLNVLDTWRDRNPNVKDFTYERPNANSDGTHSRSRLDRILLSPEVSKRSLSHSVDVGLTISDHYPVWVEVTDNESPEIGDQRWRMNLEDLEDEFAMDSCRKILLKCQNTMSREPMVKWLKAKKDIKSVLEDRQQMRCKERSRTLDALKKHRTALTVRKDFARNPGLQREEGLLRERIANIERSKLDRATESSAARFAKKGESVNKYWFSIGKSIKESSVIRTLTDEQDTTTHSTATMVNIAQSHHARMQTCPDMTPEREVAIRKMVDTTTGKRFTLESRESLNERVTPEEATQAIMSAQNGKAPGKDGIPYEFYKHWVFELRKAKNSKKKVPDITWILTQVWNDVAEGHTPPPDYVEGLMFLLYKKKRRDKIETYRLITLLGCDYKLQTKVLATRLGKNVQGTLHPDQAGFVPGRDILDHVKLAKHVKELCDVKEKNGCLVALDQEKAYDRIDHACLWVILKVYGLPPCFLQTVQKLYETATTSVLVNQTESPPFEVNRGVRQGDPLSCLLQLSDRTFGGVAETIGPPRDQHP